MLYIGVPSNTVLVADPSASSRELLRVLLEYEGWQVSEASDGQQAVAMARAAQPDLVLLDLELPCLDGYAAVRAMRLDARLKNRCFVALTANSQQNDRLEHAGFSDYITKPVLWGELSGKLSKLLPHRRTAGGM
jgi:CheY-like chemotaxis protein